MWQDHMKEPAQTEETKTENFAELLDSDEINNDDRHIPTKRAPHSTLLPPSKIRNNNNDKKSLDTLISRKLSQGKIRPEGKIDLHGLNQQEAYTTLCDYIEHAHKKGKKYILVVTGKGKSLKQPQDWFTPSAGVLKRNLPHWIKTPPLKDFVIDAISAHSKHGGGGAFYVILKNK